MVKQWGRKPFGFTLYASAQFVLLTVAAMLLYPGGTVADPEASRYRFFHNFFSDLGRTVTSDGEANTLSALLFVIALSGAGLSLVWFFLAAPRLLRRSRAGRALSVLGSLFGVVSGLAFVGVAWTPANLWLKPTTFSWLRLLRRFWALRCCTRRPLCWIAAVRSATPPSTWCLPGCWPATWCCCSPVPGPTLPTV